MAKSKEVEALEDYSKLLSELADNPIPFFKEATYEGAAVMADGIRKEIQSATIHSNASDGMTKIEQQALLKGLGISKFDVRDGANVKIGFAGYGDVPTKKWPKGVPIPLTARSLIGGTSWRVKDDFMGRAIRKNREKTIDAISNKADEILKRKFEQ
jgi:hypothetical protein